MAGQEYISIAEAARILGYKSKKTIRRLAEQGLLDIRKVRGRWMVSKAQVRQARVLTTGRAAKLAGCSAKTVRRRIKAGVVKPERPDKPSSWMCGRALARLSLNDVSKIKGSILRKLPRPSKPKKKKAPRRKPRPDQFQLFRDRTGRYWLWAYGHWWKREPPARRQRAGE